MKKGVITIILLLFIQAFIHNLGHPITPDFVKDLGIEDFYFGIFFALMSLGLVVGGPFWGILGDHRKKSLLILIGLLIYSIGQFAFGNIHNIYIMVIVRFVSGFGVSASVTLLLTLLIERSDLSHKTRNIAYGTAATGFGASLSYLLGGRLPKFLIDYSSYTVQSTTLANVDAGEIVFALQAILNVVFAFVVFYIIRQNEVVIVSESKSNPFAGLKEIKSLDSNLIVFLISLTLVSIGAINISKFTEVYISDLHQGSEGIGNFVFVTGIVGIITAIFIVPIIIKMKKDINRMIMINILSGIIIFIVFRMNAIIIGLYSVFMIYVILKAIYGPLETSFISSFAKDNEHGKLMGIRQSFFAIGFVIGPLIGGFIYDYNPLLVFDISVLMFILASIMILFVRRNLIRLKRKEIIEE